MPRPQHDEERQENFGYKRGDRERAQREEDEKETERLEDLKRKQGEHGK